MINRVVPADSLLNEAAHCRKTRRRTAASFGRIKRMLNASFSNDLPQQLALEHECQIESGKVMISKRVLQHFSRKALQTLPENN